MKSALESKGVEVGDISISGYADKILRISGASDIQGIVFDGPPKTATSVQAIPSSFTSIYTNFSVMFSGCAALTTINLFDTSNGTNFGTMFYNCSSIITVPLFNTSNWTNFQSMFTGCTALTIVPQLDVSSAPNVSSMFSGCTALTIVPQLNVSSATTLTNMFSNCSSLINFGGLLNCKKSYSLSYSKDLTHDSLMNAINGLYDLTGQTSQKLTLGSTNLAKLTAAEKAVATNKNWTLG